MKYVCVKCEDEFSYDEAFNAHTQILDQKNGVVSIESLEEEWLGERCQLCSKLCSSVFYLFSSKKNKQTNVYKKVFF
ncbi:hypothetical protein Runsl_4635 [Runella slithyformis DSM 19594]|uniref:Uncharacterized protein n=1 Tax=Runella slithyformis (strain ATCC 29530 / DSM 19594 / LMG 11500 / NCIMB 11436 / LSU 4) TaxID=761193 RepID=A0A7U3ZPG7_RUNSL|nr:hypothetical protein Runsl_4635 [Runella slithyformis DSM 19594]